MPGIRVTAAGKTYPVEIGSGMESRLNRLTRRAVGKGRLFLFYDANFFALHGNNIRKSINIGSNQVREMVIPAGERSKSAATLAAIYDFLLDQGITRSDFVLACGGGVTSDLVGYAATTVLRGVRWGVVPTTLLGMVDASIGGKTGINHDRGKNLIGAFWPPDFVCSDLNYLATLDPRQMVAGLGEITKCAGLAGVRFVELVSGFIEKGDLYDNRALTPIVRKAAEFKARIVSRDERESGPRMFLNLGHTFGHAIEKALGYGRLLHGEAVVLGLWTALALGDCCGYNSAGLREYRRLVEALVRLLPNRTLISSDILLAMNLDKKRTSRGLRFVLLERLGRPIIYDNVDRRSIRTALESMIRVYDASGG